MNSIFHGKEWLTLEESAKHISKALNIDFTEIDLLKTYLEGHLPLSINVINDHPFIPTKVIPLSKPRKIIQNPSESLVCLPEEKAFYDREFEFIGDKIVWLSGVMDIAPDMGTNALIQQNYYRTLKNDPNFRFESFDKYLLVERDNKKYLLAFYSDLDWYTQDEYIKQAYSATRLSSFDLSEQIPEDSILVVRNSSLNDLEQYLLSIGKPKDTPEQIKAREKKLGHTDKDIVVIIDATWTTHNRLTNAEIGELFKKNEHETKDCREQRGKRLRGKVS